MLIDNTGNSPVDFLYWSATLGRPAAGAAHLAPWFQLVFVRKIVIGTAKRSWTVWKILKNSVWFRGYAQRTIYFRTGEATRRTIEKTTWAVLEQFQMQLNEGNERKWINWKERVTMYIHWIGIRFVPISRAAASGITVRLSDIFPLMAEMFWFSWAKRKEFNCHMSRGGGNKIPSITLDYHSFCSSYLFWNWTDRQRVCKKWKNDEKKTGRRAPRTKNTIDGIVRSRDFCRWLDSTWRVSSGNECVIHMGRTGKKSTKLEKSQ